MNKLLFAMSADMGIDPYSGETEDSFTYRVIYSALGQWCLRIAQSIDGDILGTTKHNQTVVLNDLLDKFTKIFPSVFNKFIDEDNPQMIFPVFIRRVYEETGYLITNEYNRNITANFGRSIVLGKRTLFFGLPGNSCIVNGLGIFAESTNYVVPVKEFLIRDDLTYEEYFKAHFDPIDFYDKNIDLNSLEFFNPLSTNPPSRSWENQLKTDCSLARKSKFGPFYRVMQLSGVPQFADQPIEPQDDSFTSYEYRRLYFATKAHYGTPLKATITKTDNSYSIIKLDGHLPNREYYYLLLLSWPIRNAFDKIYFLAHNDLLVKIIGVLNNLGIIIEERGINNE